MARLLVVDDDEADRIVLRTILERASHEVWVAKDGAEALSHFQGNRIEVVITDLQMSNVHGLELITILRELTPRPGIIAISGTGEAQLDMARMMGASHTLQKPVRPDLLLNAVADLSRSPTEA
jgi:two-component system chemotaxis response regulator CheY